MNLKTHAGESAFPGGLSYRGSYNPAGKKDPTDASALSCALREIFEEVGIPSSSLLLLGQLDDGTPIQSHHLKRSSQPFWHSSHSICVRVRWRPKLHRSQPVRSSAALAPLTLKVAEIFFVPLRHFLNRSPPVYSSAEVPWRGTITIIHFFNYSGHIVFGLTARIAMALADFLAQAAL
jgi:hypothetical protein